MARFRAALGAPVALCDQERGSAVMTEEPAVPDEETGPPAPWQYAEEGGPGRVPPPLPDLLPAPVLRDAPLWDALSQDTVPWQALPRRMREGSAAGGPPEEPEPSGEADYSPPPPEVLTRVLDGLRDL